MKPPAFTVTVAGCVAIAAFVTDHATKALAVANADVLSGGLGVFPGFNLVLHRNTGVPGHDGKQKHA